MRIAGTQVFTTVRRRVRAPQSRLYAGAGFSIFRRATKVDFLIRPVTGIGF
jgi:hypothetical protein